MLSTKKSVLLLGCGYTLGRLAALLPKESYAAIVRSPESAELLSRQNINARAFNLNSPLKVSALLEDYPEVDTVIDSIPPDPENPTIIPEGLKNCRLKRIIYLSSTGVYDVTDGSWATESSPLTKSSTKGLNRIACEKAYQSINTETVSLRVSGIYGPGRGFEFSLRNSRKLPAFSADRWMNRIHVDDLTSILLHLLKKEDDIPAVMNCSDDLPCRYMDLINHYARLLELDQEYVNSLLTTSKSGNNQRVCNKLLKSVLDYKFMYPTYQSSGV